MTSAIVRDPDAVCTYVVALDLCKHRKRRTAFRSSWERWRCASSNINCAGRITSLGQRPGDVRVDLLRCHSVPTVNVAGVCFRARGTGRGSRLAKTFTPPQETLGEPVCLALR